MLARTRSRVQERLARLQERRPPLTPAQAAARKRWQDRWTLPIIVAAVLPLFATSPPSRAIEIGVGLGAWLVFLLDLIVQRRIVPDYLRRPDGWFDLGILLLTFPYYLLPDAGTGTAFLVVARLARVVRVLIATKGLRRFAARLGKVAVVAGVVVVVGAVIAYEAEHPTNALFGTFGDSLWWAIVTLTTVGYGDIYPITTSGRVIAVAIMFTGVALLGILAGSLASLFGVSDTAQEADPPPPDVASADGLRAELLALQADVQALEGRLAAMVARHAGPD